MPRITKSQIRDELRKILLIQADHLAIAASEAAAEAFIGFPLEDGPRYFEIEPLPEVDLDRFYATTLLETCCDYAFTPSILTSHDDSLVQDLQVFVLGMPQTDTGGEIHPFLTEKGICKTVATASLARFKLDEGDDLTTREIALLANITEGAVRNALADKSESGLRAIRGSKNPVMIEHTEAVRWLQGRRGFMPTPDWIADDPFILERVRKTETARELGQIISRLVLAQFRDPENASEKLGWSAERLRRWIDGTETFDADEAASLAKALDLDAPLFVGKALETTMRRDMKEAAQ